jgi:hypothetical protein
LVVPGRRLGLLTEGKTAKTNRTGAWTSYRGEGWGNIQDRGLDFLQRGRLRKQTGQELGLHTGGKAGGTYRIEAWTSYRGEDCENKRGRDWDIFQSVDL